MISSRNSSLAQGIAGILSAAGALLLVSLSAVPTSLAGKPDPPCAVNTISPGSKLERDAETGNAAPAVALVSASDVLTANKARIVTVSADLRPVPDLPGALRVNEEQLSGLVRSTNTPLAVAGSGHNDLQLARRLSRWQQGESASVVVRGGLPALVLQSGKRLSNERLAALLAIDSNDQLAIVNRRNWAVLTLDDAEMPSGIALMDRSVDNFEAVRALLGSGTSGVALIDESGASSKAVAVELSRKLSFPVFYFDGGAAEFRLAYARSESIDRRRGGRVGDIRCAR